MKILDVVRRKCFYACMEGKNDRPEKKRTIIDLPYEDLKRLDEISATSDVPRAAILRDAVAEYVVRKGKAPAAIKPLAGFGALRGYYADGLAWQETLRNEWE
ncbi:MAG: CopG family transcriptional regulator [Verrucomicrobiota bacterium]